MRCCCIYGFVVRCRRLSFVSPQQAREETGKKHSKGIEAQKQNQIIFFKQHKSTEMLLPVYLCVSCKCMFVGKKVDAHYSFEKVDSSSTSSHRPAVGTVI